MNNPKYPLEQIALIKHKRLEEAEKTLRDKKQILDTETEKLKKVKEKRDLVKAHRLDKIRKYLAELDVGTTSDKIVLHDRYIKKVVDEELKVEEKKVADQTKAVQKAEEEVEKARKDRLKKQQDTEKLDLHQREWKKEMLVEQDRLESIETDELGSNIHAIKRQKNPHPFRSNDGGDH